MTVDKVDIAVQTNFPGDLNEQDKRPIPDCCQEAKEDSNKITLKCDIENNIADGSVKSNICGIPRSMDNSAACRLATPFMPSPILDRRTIL